MPSERNMLWRMFCAVELPGEVKARFAEHVARLREAAPDVRASWERPEKVHVTVKFVGEIEEARALDLSSAAELAASAVGPFEITVEGTGTFPPNGQPRVLWLGIKDGSGGLPRLQQRLEDECAANGFPREKRAFHPHLTVARLRVPAGAKRLATLHCETEFKSETFSVNELVVMRSELGPGGSRYTALSRHRLRGA